MRYHDALLCLRSLRIICIHDLGGEDGVDVCVCCVTESAQHSRLGGGGVVCEVCPTLPRHHRLH